MACGGSFLYTGLGRLSKAGCLTPQGGLTFCALTATGCGGELLPDQSGSPGSKERPLAESVATARHSVAE